MRATTAADVGSVIRVRRHELRLSQQALSARAGVARSSLSAVEHGHPRAELDVVLRLVRALDLTVDLTPRTAPAGPDLAVHFAQFDERHVGPHR